MKLPIISTAFVAALLFCGPLSKTVKAEDDQKFHAETDTEKSAAGDVKTHLKTEATDAAGTVTKHDVEEKTEATAHGKRAKLSHTVSRDPKGLMNKKTETSEATATYDSSGALKKKSSYEGVDAAGTSQRMTSETETARKAGGGRRTVMKDKQVQDPKGLMNKHSTEKRTIVDRNADGKATVSTEKDVDGKTVERNVTEGAE